MRNGQNEKGLYWFIYLGELFPLQARWGGKVVSGALLISLICLIRARCPLVLKVVTLSKGGCSSLNWSGLFQSFLLEYFTPMGAADASQKVGAA